MKKIKNYKNYYVTENGEIYNSVTKKFLKSTRNYSGYQVITLRLNGLKKQYRINRLVAEAFLPNPENKPCVNHINGNKNDNKVSNLEWVTILENNVHAYKIGLKKGKSKGKLVINLENGVFYESAKEASFYSNIKLTTLVGYLNGNYKNKSYFKYA